MLPGESTNSKRSGNASAGPSDTSNAFVIVFDSKQYQKKTPKKSRSRRTGAAELTFINTTGSDKYAPSARQLIRTHVMSDYWRKQLKGHRSKPDVQDSSPMQYPAGLLAHLPPLGSQPLGGPDPFSRFPVEMQPYMYNLLDLYASDIVHKLCPKTKEHERNLPQCPRSIWLQRDLSDTATLQALLCAAALYVDEVSGQGFSPMRYILKKDALRTISDRLSDSESIADGTITAVAYLAIEEGVALNLSTWASHMTGLQQMIELRGGMSKLDKRVQGLTHFANLHGCDGTSLMLYFPWVTESPNQQQITYPLLLPELETDSRWDAAIEGFDTQLLATFMVIKNLTTVMNQAAESNMGVDPLVTEAAFFLMETRLLLSSVAEGEPEQKFINESCSLGIQIYLSTIFAETSDMEVAKIDLSDPISALRRNLSDIDIRTMPCPHLLIWVIFFGGMNSRDYKDRSWFAARLGEAAQFWNIYNWDSLRLTFKSFLWIDRRHDEQGLQFWTTAVVEY